MLRAHAGKKKSSFWGHMNYF